MSNVSNITVVPWCNACLLIHVQENSYKSHCLLCYRSAAYNLLCALTCTFNLKIEGQLLETSGLCIPANNTLFIVSISKTLAANEPHLTLEFLEECISGFSKSSKYHQCSFMLCNFEVNMKTSSTAHLHLEAQVHSERSQSRLLVLYRC